MNADDDQSVEGLSSERAAPVASAFHSPTSASPFAFSLAHNYRCHLPFKSASRPAGRPARQILNDLTWLSNSQVS